MKKRFSILGPFLTAVILVVVSYAQGVIPWNEAQNHYGESIAVQGKIVSTYNSGRACFLNFHTDYRKHFSAVIFKSAFSRFPANPEDFYSGKEVVVSGKIKEYKGKPEIILEDPTQIRIVGQKIATSDAQKVISWKDADKHYGEFCTVEGTVVATYNSGKACFLNFHKNWTRYFTVVIFAADFRKFPSSPEDYYKNKTIKVNGLIKEYKGKPEIVVKNPGQIQITDRSSGE
jgi:DNA/RNA endonuclease YhcR with UshA esterase domain